MIHMVLLQSLIIFITILSTCLLFITLCPHIHTITTVAAMVTPRRRLTVIATTQSSATITTVAIGVALQQLHIMVHRHHHMHLLQTLNGLLL